MKKLLITLLFLGISTYGFAISREAAEADWGQDVNEWWTCSVHWHNPEIIGDYDMQIVITTPGWPKTGKCYTSGYEGTITVNRKPNTVAWDWGQIAFYEGTWTSRTTGSGTMRNIYGNYGEWTARRKTDSHSQSTAATILGIN